MRGCRLSRRFLLRESSFQPRDVFLEALVVLQEAVAGQDTFRMTRRRLEYRS